MPIPTALSDIRSAIKHYRRMSFVYEHEAVVADFYLLGQFRKTGAYVVWAWCHQPTEEWRLFRYSRIKELDQVGQIPSLRPDFDPHPLDLATIDTQAYPVRRRDN